MGQNSNLDQSIRQAESHVVQAQQHVNTQTTNLDARQKTLNGLRDAKKKRKERIMAAMRAVAATPSDDDLSRMFDAIEDNLVTSAADGMYTGY